MRAKIFLLALILVMISMGAGASQVPASARSKQAVALVRPALEKRLNAMGLHWGAPIFLRIFKGQRCLQVWVYDGQIYKLFETFDICTYGGKGLGPKTRQGDGRAPEGFYYVAPHQLNPFSRYHLAFNLGYPNAYDCRHGRTGSALMVHGACVSIGCFAMTDRQMEIIYAMADAALRNGQPYFRVHIFPFEMTGRWMARMVDPGLQPEMAIWFGFWRELKKGYDYFEQHHRPPNVHVKDGCYLISEAQ